MAAEVVILRVLRGGDGLFEAAGEEAIGIGRECGRFKEKLSGGVVNAVGLRTRRSARSTAAGRTQAVAVVRIAVRRPALLYLRQFVGAVEAVDGGFCIERIRPHAMTLPSHSWISFPT